MVLSLSWPPTLNRTAPGTPLHRHYHLDQSVNTQNTQAGKCTYPSPPLLVFLLMCSSLRMLEQIP